LFVEGAIFHLSTKSRGGKMKKLSLWILAGLMVFVWLLPSAYAGKSTDKIKAEIMKLEKKCWDEYWAATDDMLELRRKKAKSWKIFHKGIEKKINKIYKKASAKLDKCDDKVKKYKAYYKANKSALNDREQYYEGCAKNGKNCILSCADDEGGVKAIDACEDRCEKNTRKCFKAVNKHNPLE
jgi:hypothetical protein